MDDLTESSSQIMDLEAPKLIGDGCPHLIKFYGAMHADVIMNSCLSESSWWMTHLSKIVLLVVHLDLDGSHGHLFGSFLRKNVRLVYTNS